MKNELSPRGKVDLIVIGCPQASLEEMRTTAAALRTHNGIWVNPFPINVLGVGSQENYALAEADGTVSMLEEAGALVLVDTCPEVTPYNREKYNRCWTNSMKAEHYLTSGLNRIPTSVASIAECVRHAIDPERANGQHPRLTSHHTEVKSVPKTPQEGLCTIAGSGLDSQTDFCIEGRAMVTDVPITYLGYVNRDTGVVEEAGHPLDGRAIQTRF